MKAETDPRLLALAVETLMWRSPCLTLKDAARDLRFHKTPAKKNKETSRTA